MLHRVKKSPFDRVLHAKTEWNEDITAELQRHCIHSFIPFTWSGTIMLKEIWWHTTQHQLSTSNMWSYQSTSLLWIMHSCAVLSRDEPEKEHFPLSEKADASGSFRQHHQVLNIKECQWPEQQSIGKHSNSTLHPAQNFKHKLSTTNTQIPLRKFATGPKYLRTIS